MRAHSADIRLVLSTQYRDYEIAGLLNGIATMRDPEVVVPPCRAVLITWIDGHCYADHAKVEGGRPGECHYRRLTR